MQRLLIIFAALLSGAFTWWLFEQSSQQQPVVAFPVEQAQPTEDVLVFTRPLSRGTVINADTVEWRSQLASSVPAGAILRSAKPAAISELSDMVLRRAQMTGDPVRQDALVSGAASFMALALAPEMRAVAIRITTEKLAGGFILPEDRVDVIHTVVRDLDGDGVSNGYSNTILRSVRVLAIGQRAADVTVLKTAQEQEARSAIDSDVFLLGETITLEVTPEQGEYLAAAAASGQLSLALRALEDHAPTTLGDISAFEARTAPMPLAEPETLREPISLIALPPEAPQPAPRSVIFIQSGQRSQFVAPSVRP
jgi:pilus assembly protein CpaB